MPKRFGARTKKTRDDWQTPDYIVAALGKFDLDPCANPKNPTRLARTGITAKQDGLKTAWGGRVFMNPPYGKASPIWLDKLAQYGDGIALVPPRVGSKWFHKIVFSRFSAILFLSGRIAFLDKNMKPISGNDTDSILIAFGERNVQALRDCNLPGELWVKSAPDLLGKREEA